MLRFRQWLGGAMLFGVLLVVAHAQVQPVPGGGATPETPPANQPFTLPEQRDAREQLRAVMDYLNRTNIPWDVVTTTAQRLLDAKSDSFYRPVDANGNETGAVVSIKARINQILAELPSDGKQFYEQEFGGKAAEQLKRAVEAAGDRALLSDVSQRYFHSKAGRQATMMLASADLAAGRVPLAAYGFNRLLGPDMTTDDFSPWQLFQAAVALKRVKLGPPERPAELLQAAIQRLPAGGLTLGRRVVQADDLRTEFERNVVIGRVDDRAPTTRYGNSAHNGLATSGTPFLDALFQRSLITSGEDRYREGEEWVRSNLERAIKQTDPGKREVVLPEFFPVASDGLVIFRAYDGIHAVATRDQIAPGGVEVRAGEILWRCRGAAVVPPDIVAGGAQTLFSRPDIQDVSSWWSTFWGARAPGILYQNAVLGSLSHDGERVYFVDDVAVPPPPPQQIQDGRVFGRNNPSQTESGQTATRLAQYSRLIAVDISTGALVWTLGGEERKSLTEAEEQAATTLQPLAEGAYFLGPPTVVDGKLYVLYERRGQIRLACLDPTRTPLTGDPPQPEPVLVWSQVLGDSTTSVRTDPQRRMQVALPAYSDGVLVCPTNNGVVVAVDIYARSLLWARSGNVSAAMPDANLPPGQRPRRIGRPVREAQAEPVPVDRWRASAPIITAGKVLIASPESDLLQCLDLRTGSVVWSAPRESDDLYVGGVSGETVIVVGKQSVRGLKLAGNQQGGSQNAWPPVAIGAPMGHGTCGRDGLFYVPVVGAQAKPDQPDPQVWAIDTATGAVRSKTSFRRPVNVTDPRVALGNLVFHDGLLYSQTPFDLTAYPLLEPKRREMAARLEANPRDPEGLVIRGELSLDNGDLKDAIADLHAAREQKPTESLLRRLNQKLYTAYSELGRVDFSALEPYLDEYENLCQIPVDADEPAERRRQLDEAYQRRALFLTQLARGRETQHDSAAAIRAYRSLAELEGGPVLSSQNGDPSIQIRPDVWAASQIGRILRTDPARSALSTTIEEEWQQLRAEKNVRKLRAFAAIYGRQLAQGREARLALAESLLARRLPPDTREAIGLLREVWVMADDPTSSAQAIERLARFLSSSGTTEDAIGFYRLLGTDFADVRVQPDQTGAEVFAAIVSNRRMHPHLEPATLTPPKNYSLEVKTTPTNPTQRAGVVLTPTGSLFPSLERYRFLIEPDAPDGSTVALLILDPASGDVRARFLGLNSGQAFTGRADNAMTGFANPSMPRPAVVSGHLMLLTLGHMVYCLDLLSGREAWRASLLGKSPPVVGTLVREETGGVTATSDDGWMFKVGQNTILEPTHACLLTRDGLRVLDPATGLDRWTRTGISVKAQIFGDTQHIFVVDGSQSQIFAADDGQQIEPPIGFAGLYNSRDRVGMVGRNMLLAQPGEDGRVLKLYDPLTSRDVWTRNYPDGTVTARTAQPTLTGVLTPDGRFEMLRTSDGERLTTAQVDPEIVKSHTKIATNSLAPFAILDAERCYLVLPRVAARAVGRAVRQPQAFDGNRFNSGMGTPALNSTWVDGPIIAFDRSTGKRLWYNLDSLNNQLLIFDSLAASPVFVAFNTGPVPNVEGGADSRGNQSRLVVMDKRTGRLMHQYNYAATGPFSAATIDVLNQTIEFSRYDLSVKITAREALADTPSEEKAP